MQWNDVSVCSKNPSVFVIDIADMRVRVYRLDGGDKGSWFISTFNPCIFDRKLLKSKDIKKAKHEALMLVRDRANKISASVTVALMSEDKNES